jgi:hypothetical protein
MHEPSRENGVHMFVGLPLRHRAAIAIGLYVVAVVVGTWASTLVGDPTPTIWGVALGGFAGLALALKVLLARATFGPVRGGAPARR